MDKSRQQQSAGLADEPVPVADVEPLSGSTGLKKVYSCACGQAFLAKLHGSDAHTWRSFAVLQKLFLNGYNMGPYTLVQITNYSVITCTEVSPIFRDGNLGQLL